MANAPSDDQFVNTTFEVQGGGTATRDMLEPIRAYAKALQTAMKEEAPINKDPYATSRGRLRSSIEAAVRGGNGSDATISFIALDYVRYVLGGTAPHIIRPSSKRALAFKWRTGLEKFGPHHGRGPGGGLLRSTPHVGLLGPTRALTQTRLISTNRLAARHNLSRGNPRFGGRVITGGEPRFNQVGRQIRGPQLGNIHPVNVKKNMDQHSENYGNIVLSYVHHPGTKPNDFITRAVDKVEDDFQVMADALGRDWADDLVAAFKESAT
jgi:hypothetical protein